MPIDKNKLNKLLKDLEKIKATKGDPLAGLLFDLEKKISVMKGEQGIQGEKGDKGERGDSIQGERGKDGRNGFDGKDGKNGKDGRDGRDGVDGRDGERGLQGLNGADGSPETGEMIVAKLSELEDEERLDVKAIKGLEELVKKLEKRIDGKVVYVGSSSGGLGGHVQYYDLSSQLNGSLRVFSMPAFARILSVQLSSFPNILRPLVDWTSDASASTLTLTSEIPDASISAGQTMVVLYANL